MKTIIVYGSHYGTSNVYAHKLSQFIKCKCVASKKVNSLFNYERIIYIGSIYAGKIADIKEILSVMNEKSEFIVITVGIANPENEKNVAHILNSAKKQIPSELFKRTKFYHLRGALDYHSMSLQHKIMMKMMCISLKLKPKNKITDEDRLIIDSYGKSLDFVDFAALKKIADDIK